MKGIKQGVNYLMPINVGVELELVDKIVFVCEQGEVRKMWTYPSETATRIEGTNVINLEWSWEDTFDFRADASITLDSKVFLASSKYNPPTTKVSFTMDSTLFTESEIGDMDD